jgi:hypothetical protein
MAGLKENFVCQKRTICEVHREMYDIIFELSKRLDTNALLELLEEAFNMAKKMSNKLYEYKYNLEQHSEENSNYDASMQVRNQRGIHSK